MRLPAAAEDYPDLFQQYRHGKGLGYIVIDVHGKTPELLLLSIQSGEHENGNLGLPADQFTDPKAVDFGEHQVQQHQIKGLFAKQGQGCHSVPGCCGFVAGILQIGTQQLLDVWLVFCNQNVFHQQSPD